jgi:hypothetical protein
MAADAGSVQVDDGLEGHRDVHAQGLPVAAVAAAGWLLAIEEDKR